jgi:hypothetical protein
MNEPLPWQPAPSMLQGMLTHEEFERAAQLFAADWAAHRPQHHPWHWTARRQPITGTVGAWSSHRSPRLRLWRDAMRWLADAAVVGARQGRQLHARAAN